MPAGALPPPIPPQVQAKLDALQRIAGAIALLRDQKLRGFRVDIEVDSTIFADVSQEKQDRSEFITRVTEFMTMAAQLGAQLPPAVPLLGKMLTFAARGFRIGRDLEMAIEDFTEQATVYAHQFAASQQNKPDPAMAKVQIEAKKADAQIQGIQMKNQAEERANQAEVQRQQIENQGEQANSAADLKIKELELQMRQMEVEIEKIRAAADVQKIHGQQRVEAQKSVNEVQKMHSERARDQQHMANEQQKMAYDQHRDQQQMAHEERQADRQEAHEGRMMEHQERQAERQAAQPRPKPAGGE